MKVTVITVCRNDLDATVEWLENNHFMPGGWISEPDKGIYDAMNKGTERATGEYLVYMNSGDAFAVADVISKTVNQIESQAGKPDLVYGDALDTLGDGRIHYRPAISLSRILFSMPTRHQSMFFRRKSLDSRPYPEGYPLSGDYALIAQLSQRKSLHYLRVDFPVSIFYLGGIHTTRRSTALQEDYAIRRNILLANPLVCGMYFCIHLAHHYFRIFLPNINKKLVYDP